MWVPGIGVTYMPIPGRNLSYILNCMLGRRRLGLFSGSGCSCLPQGSISLLSSLCLIFCQYYCTYCCYYMMYAGGFLASPFLSFCFSPGSVLVFHGPDIYSKLCLENLSSTIRINHLHSIYLVPQKQRYRNLIVILQGSKVGISRQY